MGSFRPSEIISRKVQEEVVLAGPGVLDKTMLGVIWTIAFLYGCLSEQILSQAGTVQSN